MAEILGTTDILVVNENTELSPVFPFVMSLSRISLRPERSPPE
jgi:hypothetical protein